MSGNEQNKNMDAAKADALRKLMAQLMAQRAELQRTGQEARKPIEEYKFWKTQPVTKFEADSAAAESTEQSALESKTVDEVAKVPQKLPAGFEWCTVDVTKESELQELYDLLYGNYVEDDEEQFRFKYSLPFLKWALTPPGWNYDFAVGIRASDSGKLLAFISGIPTNLVIRKKSLDTVEINFLCVHKKLRSKRMAPVLIKEITRRVNLTNVWQALFTAGAVIPTPVSTARYYHRVINWSKLYEVGFASLPSNSTKAQEVARCAIPKTIDLEGFRTIEKNDVKQVTALFNEYISKFPLHPQFSEAEVEHWFVGGDGNTTVMGYVVESSDGTITDFISAYGLESSVLGNAKHSTIQIAYAFYYATKAPENELKPRLEKLFRALLVRVKENGYDVLNALTVMDNPLFMSSLKFKPGDGFLNYNLFNWRTPPISGGIDEKKDMSNPGGVGVVLL